ncbi:MAG: type II secretion system F family protein [Ilumatobacteraceae bacterium]
MTTFGYSATSRDGSTIIGRHRARSVGDLRRWLDERELTPSTITEVERRGRLEITPARTRRKVLVHFTRQLAVFIHSGIQLVPALRILADETEDRALRRALGTVIDEVVVGETLSEATSRHPQVFPHHYVGLLRSAERTGRLEDTLTGLTDSLQRDIDTRAAIIGALSYPLIVVFLSFATVALLTGYVLPQFEPLFAELGTDLPLPTQLLLQSSAAITDHLVVPIGGLSVALGGVFWCLTTKRGRRLVDRWSLRLPVVRSVVRFVILERFCRILAAMVRAGIPVPEGLAVGSQAIGNSEVRRRLELARLDVERGRGFAAPLAATGLFPAATILMFRVGEETGTLEDQLIAASRYLDVELTQRIRKFTSLFEPAMIIGVGLTVGFVAIALVSAMYGVLDGVEQTP